MSILEFATSAPEALLEAERNFRQTAFHRIGCIDKCMTETMNEMRAFNSLRNVATVNTTDSMECRSKY